MAGPFHNWPTGKGFEYFYGFLAGEASQYEPNLVRNTTSVLPPKTPEEGYHLSEDLADDAIGWLRQHQAFEADKPFFMYWASGCLHGPHHIMKEWADHTRPPRVHDRVPTGFTTAVIRSPIQAATCARTILASGWTRASRCRGAGRRTPPRSGVPKHRHSCDAGSGPASPECPARGNAYRSRRPHHRPALVRHVSVGRDEPRPER